MKLVETTLVHTALLSALIATSACSATSVQEVPLPDQSVAIEDANMSRIYLLRPPQTYGKVRGVRLYINDLLIGSVATGDYLCWERPPGRVLMIAYYDPIELTTDDVEGILSVDTEAGKTYYCAVEIEHGTFKPKLRSLSTIEGEKLLGDLEPAQD